MMEDFKAQAVRFGAEVEYGEITHLDLSQRPMKVVVDEETGFSQILLSSPRAPQPAIWVWKTKNACWGVSIRVRNL